LRDKLGERIRSVRRSAGLSQTEFGEKLDISLPTVVRLEGGNGQAPRLDLVLRIAESFSCDVGWLVTGERRAAGIPVLASLEPTGDDQPVERLVIPGLGEGGVAVLVQSDDAAPTVRPGDYVVLADVPIANGDLIVFRSRWGESKARRLIVNRDERRLAAETQDLPEIIVDNTIKIFGKVTSIIRHIKL
jgi:transcriptional regulator with XRE-family HTH domain